jgi:hypothetical protein
MRERQNEKPRVCSSTSLMHNKLLITNLAILYILRCKKQPPFAIQFHAIGCNTKELNSEM